MSVVTFILSKKDSKKIILDGNEITVAVAKCFCNSYDIYRAYEGEGYHKRAILSRLAIAEKSAKNFKPDFVCFLYDPSEVGKRLIDKEVVTLYPYREGDYTWCDTPQYTGMTGKSIRDIKKISGRHFRTTEERIG